jgi:hypothetical protein
VLDAAIQRFIDDFLRLISEAVRETVRSALSGGNFAAASRRRSRETPLPELEARAAEGEAPARQRRPRATAPAETPRPGKKTRGPNTVARESKRAGRPRKAKSEPAVASSSKKRRPEQLTLF